MFSLIITIISIALVAALALATLYYGGDAFNRGSVGARAAQLINEGQQINGAVALYKADTGAGKVQPALSDVAGLVTQTYLAGVPTSFKSDAPVSGTTVTASVAQDVCEEIVKRSGQADIMTPGATKFNCVADSATTPTLWTFSFAI